MYENIQNRKASVCLSGVAGDGERELQRRIHCDFPKLLLVREMSIMEEGTYFIFN